MIYFTKRFLSFLGIDGAIGFTVLSRIISASGGLITLTFIALFLSQEEQGYYYTFGSIIAIQVFFELGLNGIITQYVAHEVAHLQWKSETELFGDVQHLSRLSSLLHFCTKVFTSIAFFLFIVLEISGYIFFTRYHNGTETISWQMPWTLVALSTSLMFIINPVLAFVEGLGKVKEIAQLRFYRQLLNISTIGLVLILGGKLWTLGIASFMSFSILTGGILFSHRKKILIFLYKAKQEWQINYWKEIFPYQWKIAISWISGYFIFQLFNPVLFATEGPIAAGQMGMTLAVLNSISSLSMSWITTKIPTFSSFIALKEYTKLDHLFNKTQKQMILVVFLLLGILISVIYSLNLLDIPLGKRFLPLTPFILLCIVIFINQFVFSWATYLRCHKKEPFLVSSTIVGLLCAISTIILGKSFGLMGIVLGYFIISTFIGFIWSFFIFKTKRHKWH